MNIEERMVRREPEDVIEIGRSLEVMYSSPAGSILRAMVNGRISLEAKQHREGSPIKAGRALGRIEAYQTLLDDIELAISQYYSLIKPLPENEEQEDTNETR